MDRAAKKEAVVKAIKEKFGVAVRDVSEYTGDTKVLIALDSIHDVLLFLRDEHHFVYLTDLFGADRFTSEDRFEVIYNIVSLKTGVRLFVKTWCPEENPVVPTATDIWPGANWNEREVWDMFGIRFEGHPDHRRIYMPEDYQYHPMRKEFPLLGIPGSIDLPTTTPDTE